MTTEEAISCFQSKVDDYLEPEKRHVYTVAIAALRAIQRLGKFGQLFLDYEGCPRGAAGRSALPLEEEVLSMPKIKDIGDGEWIPVNADALTELVGRYKILCAQQETRKTLKLEEWENHEPLTLDELREMGGEPVWVDFNQGLDARLITSEIAKLLAGLHWIRFVRLSCDTSAMLPVIERAAAYLQEAGVAKSRLWAYALVQDVEEAHRRVLTLDKLGVTPFAQPYRDYDGGEPTREQKDFARWVNNKAIFRSCRWEDFRPRK